MASCYTKAQRDLIASFQCQNKNLIQRIEKYESDPLFIRIEEDYKENLAAIRASYEKRVRELSEKLRRAERKLERIGREWMEVVGDVEKEKDRELGKKDKEIEHLREKAAEKASEKKTVLWETTELREKIHDLEDEIKKLRGRLDMDFTNSSTLSSCTQFRAPVKNSREPSGKKPGAQDGHEGHRRPKLEPTMPPIIIEAPREILDDPSWYIKKDRDGEPESDEEDHRQRQDRRRCGRIPGICLHEPGHEEDIQRPAPREFTYRGNRVFLL